MANGATSANPDGDTDKELPTEVQSQLDANSRIPDGFEPPVVRSNDPTARPLKTYYVRKGDNQPIVINAIDFASDYKQRGYSRCTPEGELLTDSGGAIPAPALETASGEAPAGETSETTGEGGETAGEAAAGGEPPQKRGKKK